MVEGAQPLGHAPLLLPPPPRMQGLQAFQGHAVKPAFMADFSQCQSDVPLFQVLAVLPP